MNTILHLQRLTPTASLNENSPFMSTLSNVCPTTVAGDEFRFELD